MHTNQARRHSTPASKTSSWPLLRLLIWPTLLIFLVECKQQHLIDAGSSEQDLRYPRIQEAHVTESEATRLNQRQAANRTTSVTDLRLTADYRAARLRWIYRRDQDVTNRTMKEDRSQRQQQQVEPASFAVRFCELTTWKAEIKCQNREMFVGNKTNITDNSVITTAKPTSGAHQSLTVLRHNNEFIEYEAQFFDLRALTNYTFRVKVFRFSDEESPATTLSNISEHIEPNEVLRTASKSIDRSTVARRLILDQSEQSESNELVGRLETKPFRAEATKCLADVSEVVITTGKYFGGRITVENSSDKRCQLIGNKSSEQTSYTFKIDHEICHSKVSNGNRIETMILVHENKNILTHNTARFLVLCNFLQRSFTVRASISLPKVNGIMGSRRAQITALNGKPSSKEQSVLLGSIPGVFRAKETSTTTTDATLAAHHSTDDDATVAAGRLNQSTNELDIASVSEKMPIKKVDPQSDVSRHRQPKGLSQSRTSPIEPSSMAETLHAESSSLPEPLEVQSKPLQVIGHAATARPLSSIEIGTVSRMNTASISATSNRAESLTNQEDSLQSRKKKLLDSAKREDEEVGSESSIIMTNNHRVAGDYLPTSSLRLTSSSSLPNSKHHAPDDDDFSIKYSGANINEYPVGQQEGRSAPSISKQQSVVTIMADNDMAPKNQATTISHRMRGERTGRMHNIDAARELLSPPLRQLPNDTDGQVRLATAAATTDRRMGDVMMAENGTDLLADTSNNESEIHQPPPTFNQSSSSSSDTIVTHTSHSNLAQNLTNYLLKWSLKTLTNLAKKSLESLANRTGSNSNNGFAASETGLGVESDEDPLPNVKLSTPVERQHHLKTATAATATTTVGTQIDQHRSASTVAQPPMASFKDYASTSDGFDTHSRPLQRVQQSPGSTSRLSTTLAPTSTHAPKVEGTQAANKHETSQQQHRLKPANFSKDAETTKARQLQGAFSKATSVDQQRDYLARSNESGHTRHDRGESSHLAPHGVSWLLIGCLLVLVLLIGLLAIFCLTSSSSYPPLGGHTVINAHHQQLPTHQSAAAAAAAVAGKKVTSLPRLVFSGTIVANERCDVGHQCRRMVETPPGYENYDYNRFENHPRDASASSREGASPASSGTSGSSSSSRSRSRIGSSSSGGDSLSPLGNRQSKSAHHLGPSSSVMISSRSTRSTSMSSSSSELDGENNCNNSELLLTEHVLMGANSRANESYA